jgi:hypothetical protein
MELCLGNLAPRMNGEQWTGHLARKESKDLSLPGSVFLDISLSLPESQCPFCKMAIINLLLLILC